MNDRPIIFSAPMILALLAGRKTQTRRILKPTPDGDVIHHGIDQAGKDCWTDQSWASHRMPYAVGDRLWVRETCRAEELSRPQRSQPATRLERQRLGRTTVIECDELDGADGVRYLADDAWSKIENTQAAGDAWSDMFFNKGRGKDHCGNPVSPIHMPRWASRLTLDVTDVRVQRLQDISEEDAEAEGIPAPYLGDADPPWEEMAVMVSRAMQFRNLWNNLHGADAWAENPWVAAVSFTVRHGNIDAPSPTPQVRRGGDRAEARS